MSGTYTWEEVSKHNQETDLWIVYKDGVYDLTKFYKEHPGGEEVLIDLAGKDATKCFDDIGHSGEAIQLRESYKIGTVTGSAVESSTSGGVQNTATDDDDDKWEYEPAKYESSPWLPFFVALGAAVYACIFYYYFWQS